METRIKDGSNDIMQIYLNRLGRHSYNLLSVLVTGGLGFIGSHICDLFIESGHDITIFDNMSSNVLPQEYYKSRADVFIGNIEDTSIVNTVSSKKYDLIFHFAANASVPKSIENEQLNFESNVIGTHNIIRMACKQRSSLVLASTSAVYGESPRRGVNEDQIKSPISPYGISKLISEDLCFHYGRINGNKVVAFRLFNVYGPRQRRYVISDFLEKVIRAKDTKFVQMLGTGNEVRDFVNIEDVIRAITLPLRNENMWGGAYNVGTGIQTKIRDVVDLMLNELGLTYNISFSGKSRPGDVLEIYPNVDKLTMLGFQPTIDLRTGIKKFIEYERKNGMLEGERFIQ